MRTLQLAIALILCPSVLWAQDATTECVNAPFVVFDHAAKPEIMSSSLKLRDKQVFMIRVIHTDPTAFNYRVTGATAVPQPRQRIAGEEPSTIHEECVTHSKQFGGYLMRVERKAVEKPREQTQREGDPEPLPNKLFIVSVETDDWNYEISGGFSVTRHRDPLYALQPIGEGQFRVVEDTGEDKRDDARLGVVSLITVFHSRHPNLGGSFGLGINEGANATYYLGATWRFGNVAGLTGGVAWGPVTRLPRGVNVSDVVTDANLLSTRETRQEGALFICVSYSFLGSLDTLKKPFAGQ
jgi:hypothetical protein